MIELHLIVVCIWHQREQGGIPVDTLEDRAAVQSNLDSMKEQATNNLLKLNQDMCKVFLMGRGKPLQQQKLGPDWLGSSSAEKDLWGAGSWQARQEPAACPGCKAGWEQPGMYQQEPSQEIWGSDYPLLFTLMRPYPASSVGAPIEERD